MKIFHGATLWAFMTHKFKKPSRSPCVSFFCKDLRFIIITIIKKKDYFDLEIKPLGGVEFSDGKFNSRWCEPSTELCQAELFRENQCISLKVWVVEFVGKIDLVHQIILKIDRGDGFSVLQKIEVLREWLQCWSNEFSCFLTRIRWVGSQSRARRTTWIADRRIFLVGWEGLAHLNSLFQLWVEERRLLLKKGFSIRSIRVFLYPVFSNMLWYDCSALG